MSEQEQQEEGAERPPPDEPDELEVLLAQTANLTKVLVAAGISAVLLTAGLVHTYRTLNQRIYTVTEGPLSEMTSMVTQLGNDYINVNMALEFHTHQVAAMGEQIESFDPSVDQQKFSLLTEVMQGQEKDYQQFLETVKIAMRGLSEMVSGSRSWRDDFDTKLDAAIELSKSRQLRFIDMAEANFTGSGEMAGKDPGLAGSSTRQ
jgi:hypothetical protein